MWEELSGESNFGESSHEWSLHVSEIGLRVEIVSSKAQRMVNDLRGNWRGRGVHASVSWALEHVKAQHRDIDAVLWRRSLGRCLSRRVAFA